MTTQFLRIRSIIPVMVGAWTALAGLLVVHPAQAQDVLLQNILASEFERPFTVSGIGVVVGLEGTGDTGANFAAARIYAEQLLRSKAVDEADTLNAILKEGSIALVSVSARIPTLFGGAQTYDCQGTAAGGGTESLAGGTLWIAPLRSSRLVLDADADLEASTIGFAEGRLRVEVGTPTRGVIPGGFQLADAAAPLWEEFRALPSVIFDLQIPAYRSAVTMRRLVEAINDELLEDGFIDLARMISMSQIEVMVPENEEDAFLFAGRILGQSIDFRNMEPPAEIRWNPATEVLVISGNVKISSAVVSVKGITIQSVVPERPATLDNPRIETERFIAMSGRETPSLTLATLKNQLDQLQIPTRDQAAVLRELFNLGAIGARFIQVDLDS